MSIIINTKKPKALVKAIYKAIDEGEIRTWVYDDDDEDFTHTAEQYEDKAWFRPEVTTGILKFDLIPMEGQSFDKGIPGIYHGRFVEMLFNHFYEYTISILIEF